MSDTQVKIKGFWQKPEGTLGMFVGVGIFVGVAYLLYIYMGALMLLAQNVVYLTFMILAFVAMVYVVVDSRMRNLIFYFYKSLMRFLTGLIIETDPIGILKTYISKLEKKREVFLEKTMNTKQQLTKLKNAIDENQKQIENNLYNLKKARENNNASSIEVYSRKVGRLNDSNERLGDLHDKLNIVYDKLMTMKTVVDVTIEDIKDEVNVKSKEYEISRASCSALKSAMNIIRGEQADKEIYNETLEYLVGDYAMKIGEIESILDSSEDFVNSIDFQNGRYKETAFAMLDNYDTKRIESKKAPAALSSSSSFTAPKYSIK